MNAIASIICFEMNHTPPGGVHQVKPDVHPAFLKQRQACAEAIEQQMREEKERKDAERAKALAEKAYDEQFDERWQQKTQGATAEAYAKVEAERQLGLRRQADEKAQHEIEIRLLGKALADELKPEFQAMTAAIVNAIAQMKGQ
jgi:hypothetical protein